VWESPKVRNCIKEDKESEDDGKGVGNTHSRIEGAGKKNGLRCPPSPEKTSCRVPVSWLILPVAISLSQKIQAYMILSLQGNEVENLNGSSNERKKLT
jgi:hypothetical protein